VNLSTIIALQVSSVYCVSNFIEIDRSMFVEISVERKNVDIFGPRCSVMYIWQDNICTLAILKASILHCHNYYLVLLSGLGVAMCQRYAWTIVSPRRIAQSLLSTITCSTDTNNNILSSKHGSARAVLMLRYIRISRMSLDYRANTARSLRLLSWWLIIADLQFRLCKCWYLSPKEA